MAVYYVDSLLGNDSNAGTAPGSGNAWATIAKAVATAVAGDVCNIKASAPLRANVDALAPEFGQ